MARTVRIGCGGGFWGDSPEGAAQLVRKGEIDYLVMDYLAEITMSILARMKAKDPALGYATDFVTQVMEPLGAEIAAKGIKVVTNAGGVNADACRAALEEVFAAKGVALKIAVVSGDDISDQADSLREAGTVEMFTGAEMPAKFSSVNAYLGAFPIAKALAEGADIVLTGRVVDSAVVLGPLIHEFGWGPGDHDLLSAGSLAGHLVECGAQATGGIFTDWREVEGWDDMGFPIAVCAEDGTFEMTKPEGTGGLVTPATIAEQMVYEVGDPIAYRLPDVTCDWSRVTLEQTGPDRVRVSGAQGRAPGDTLKVSATYAEGYRSAVTMMIAGREAAAKAQATGEAILKRASRLMTEAGFGPFLETQIEVLGAESNYGAQARAKATREVVLKLAVRHGDRKALGIFAREIYPAATSMAQGITGFAGGRPAPQPIIRLFSFLVPKRQVTQSVTFDGKTVDVPHTEAQADGAATAAPVFAEPKPLETGATVPLIALAHGRSGDKGDWANIGLMARDPDYLPYIRAAVTPASVADWFRHFVKGRVDRYDWPGIDGLNFVMQGALGSGGVASLRHDPQGKALAQILLDMPVPVPAAWVEDGGRLAHMKDDTP